MADLPEELVMKLGQENADHTVLINQMYTMLSTYPPPFLYVYDPWTSRITSSVIKSLLECMSCPKNISKLQLRYALVNGVACFSTRILFDAILNSLARRELNWEDGSKNWAGADQTHRWNESMDGFLHGLRALRAENTQDVVKKGKARSPAKGMGKARSPAKGMRNAVESLDLRLVIVIEHAERLKDTMPDLIVPMTRLAELSQTDVSVVFLSEVRWEDIKPSLGASPDPYYIDVPPPTKDSTLKRLKASFLKDCSAASSSTSGVTPYHQGLLSLYEHFISLVYSICSPFTDDPLELAYIAAARWPGFVRPVIDEFDGQKLSSTPSNDRQAGKDWNIEEGRDNAADVLDLSSYTEDARMRLTRLFTPTITAAMESLYPRLTDAADWAKENSVEHLLTSGPQGHTSARQRKFVNQDPDQMIRTLPRMWQFILVAAFLASNNPAKSDLRMFGRGLDEKKKRRKGGGPRKSSNKSGTEKIPQRLVGPAAFPLDRLIAILGVLLEENDVDTRPPAPEFTIPGEYTEMEIGRVHTLSSVLELTSMHLLHRTSPSDKLDSPPTFKCGISYEIALALARQLEIPLNDLMWDPA